MPNASDDNGRQGRDVAMDMRTTSKSDTSSFSPEPSIQRIVRFDTGARQSAISVGEMASGLDFDLDTFSPLGSFTPKDSKRSPVNSVISYPDLPYRRPTSTAPSSIKSRNVRQDKHGVMAKYLYKKVIAQQWLESAQDEDANSITSLKQHRGVVLQRPDGSYVAHPPTLHEDIVRAVLQLNVPVAFTMSSETTAALIRQTDPNQTLIGNPRSGNPVLPIIDSVESLALGLRKVAQDNFICLCWKEQFVLVWGDNVEEILAQGNDIETWLVGVVWGAQVPSGQSTPRDSNRVSSFGKRASQHYSMHHAVHPSTYMPSMPGPFGMETPQSSEKFEVIQSAIAKEEEGDRAYDPEKDGKEAPVRPFMLTHAVCIALAMVLVVVVEMACIAKLLTEVRLDENYIRFALLATIPVFGAFSLFFMVVIMGSIFQLFGPLAAASTNSVFYSAKAPKPGRYADYELPHVTIQMPVYKEGLKGVIMPTIESVMAAVRFYERRGGTASIFVNDDGMQLVKPELAEARRAYYEMNNIGWCSRPPHCSKPDDPNFFIRKGKFKKASNMNYCLDFAGRVEDEWLRLIAVECEKRNCSQDDLSIDDEEQLYDEAREMIIKNDNGRTWAAGNVRMGELILIIDSDTRVPEDSLLFGALEMHESPEVALIQHASGILQVVNNVFENGITYFTNLIYTSIQFAVGSGDVAPFVGHNTFIRWKAIQSISWEEDGMTKYWSDCHVSEDFDVSLRLQINGYVIRLATYHDGGFKEGVSLTVYDELARWEKYAYGCNELVFHPIKDWWRRGPITPLFRRFLGSNIKITSKITIVAYIGTYYAIASAIPLTLANYLIVGWFVDQVDQFYITSWKIFVGMAVVFNILSPLAYAMLRHRLGQKTFFVSLWETIKWSPMFILFFGGLSFHLFKALLCHAFSINMEWTTTAKELEGSGFRIGLDRVVKDFKWMYAFIFPLVGGMIYLACFAPYGWDITDFAAIVPLANQIGCHALLPFALGLF